MSKISSKRTLKVDAENDRVYQNVQNAVNLKIIYWSFKFNFLFK